VARAFSPVSFIACRITSGCIAGRWDDSGDGAESTLAPHQAQATPCYTVSSRSRATTIKEIGLHHEHRHLDMRRLDHFGSAACGDCDAERG
jgi:hypothetical protein